MKKDFLFPHYLQKSSGIIFWISFLLLILFYTSSEYLNFESKTKVFALVGNTKLFGDNEWFGWIENSIIDEVLFFILIISGLIYAFSKEKIEDEMVSKIRLNSLVYATIFNYILILLAYIFVYGFTFINVMMVALFSQLLFFIIRYKWEMYRYYKSFSYEE